MSLFWKIVDNLETDSEQAHIVVGLQRKDSKDNRGPQLGELLSRDLFRCLRLGQNSEAVLVIATDMRNCQDMVVRLGEMGVQQLHAVHPKPGEARQSGGKTPEMHQ